MDIWQKETPVQRLHLCHHPVTVRRMTDVALCLFEDDPVAHGLVVVVPPVQLGGLEKHAHISDRLHDFTSSWCIQQKHSCTTTCILRFISVSWSKSSRKSQYLLFMRLGLYHNELTAIKAIKGESWTQQLGCFFSLSHHHRPKIMGRERPGRGQGLSAISGCNKSV